MQAKYLNDTGPMLAITATCETFPSSDQSGLFPGAYPASPPVSPGSEEARRMTAGSGQRLLPWLTAFGPHGSYLKTLLESCLSTMEWNSSVSVLRWKVRGTKFNRLLFQLAPLARRTDETGYGLLPTVRSSERAASASLNAVQNITNPRGNLEEAIYEATGLLVQPPFAEWMMGYPSGWTSLEDLETPSSPKSPTNLSSE